MKSPPISHKNTSTDQVLSENPASRFPRDFVWGAAAASYQIEGAAREDGRGPSVWDMFCAQPGKILHGENGDVSCDHYHRFREDVGLMKQMKLQAYRFSISWSRVLPEGVGTVNKKGLAFYDSLVDELLAAGIAPYCTLFHWDYPYALYSRGGWLSPDSPKWFADYARVVADRLSDRVRHWITLNEPQCFVWLGHHDGNHAPGLKLSMRDVLTVSHHALMAHGAAVKALRETCKQKPQIGWAPVAVVQYPETDSPADIEAARRGTFSVDARNLWNNTWYSDPVCLGHYPDDGLKVFAADMPTIRNGDLELICQPLDFYGANLYHGRAVRAEADGSPELLEQHGTEPMTAMRWHITPPALRWAAKFLYERYKLPILITENGISCTDWIAADGAVHDPNRIDFTLRYLRELKRAIDEGVDVRGYLHWSVMDNFEWAQGYQDRFGLTYVEYKTQQRILKDSALWYRGVIETNGHALYQVSDPAVLR